MKQDTEPLFEREYFEEKASYGQSGGYSSLVDQSARYYAEYFRLASRAVPHLNSGGGRRAIEVGCAFGAGSAWLDEHGWNTLATDVSAYACERARALLPQTVDVRQLDIREALSTFTERFELVACIQVIEHVADERFSAALCELVAPGGFLVVATPNPRSVSPYRKFQADPTHINEQAPSYWIDRFRANGLTIVQSGTYHIVPFLGRFIVRYLRVPERIGYDTLIVATRPTAS